MSALGPPANVDGQKPVVAVMNPSLSAGEGGPGSLEMATATKPTLDTPGMNVRFRMRAQPLVMSDGRVSVSGSFAFEWTIKQGAINQIVFSSPDVPITASLEQGKSQNVATIRMGAGLAGREAVLDVTLTASVEKGRLSPSAPMPTLFPRREGRPQPFREKGFRNNEADPCFGKGVSRNNGNSTIRAPSGVLTHRAVGILL